LRLRDLAGLIVVDFIDMEESRNNRSVERRMKDALKNDRARIQVGRISHFGLLEMSRQRIRTGVLEGSTVVCQHCMGAGVVRSTSSVALHVLRVLEDALIKSAANDMTVRARTAVALYILNQKRVHLRDLERRFGVVIMVEADDTLTGANYHALERGEPASGVRAPDSELEHRPAGYGAPEEEEEFFIEETPEAEDEIEVGETEASEDESEETEAEGGEGEATGDDADRSRRKRRRRRRRGGERPAGEIISADAPQPTDDGLAVVAEIGGDFSQVVPVEGEEGGRPNGPRRRRSRRGRGRRRAAGGRGSAGRRRFGVRAGNRHLRSRIAAERNDRIGSRAGRARGIAVDGAEAGPGRAAGGRRGRGRSGRRGAPRPGRSACRARGGSADGGRTGADATGARADRRGPQSPAPFRLVAARSRDHRRGMNLTPRASVSGLLREPVFRRRNG